MRDVQKPYNDNNNQRRSIATEEQQPIMFEESSSGVAWPAVIGGAICATAISLLLLVLGAGVGLSTISPWQAPGSSAASSSIMGTPIKTIVWLIAMQIIASGFGGYLAGRLRTKWVGLNSSEVFFRDTANGFLSWAVATIIAATIFASAASMVISGSVRAMSAAITPMSEETGNNMNNSIPLEGLLGPNSYLIANLFRTTSPVTSNESPIDAREEASNIVINSIKTGGMSDADKTLLAQTVMSQTGVPQDEALRRVDDITAQISKSISNARETFDTARKVSAYLALFVCISMLVGAFVASYSAALGGQHRDNASAA